jgi:YVTN family beta-propeller protein
VFDSTPGADLGTIPASGYLLAVDARIGHVFVAGRAGRLSMLDACSGALLRMVAVGGQPIAAVDERTGRVFVANFDEHTVSVLDATSGAVLHTIAVGPHPSAPAVEELPGRVVVVDPFYSGVISMLDATSGRALCIVAEDKGRAIPTLRLA